MHLGTLHTGLLSLEVCVCRMLSDTGYDEWIAWHEGENLQRFFEAGVRPFSDALLSMLDDETINRSSSSYT